MAASGEDELLWPCFPNDFDENEWEWPEMPDAELAPERRPTEPSASVGDACFAKTAPSSRG